MNQIAEAPRIENEQTEIRNESFDIVFIDLNLTVIDATLMKEEQQKLGWKRFIPFKKRRIPKIEKKILENVTGIFRWQRFTAILGTSGAGKTSLLNQISGQLPKDTKTSGKIFMNGKLLDYNTIKDISGFVFQDDVILETMTVEEALKMSVKLRLPPETNKKQRIE